jgi:uroporphyrinogen-III synthase
VGISPLAGFTVAVTADRRREEQVELLRRRGASIIEGPTVRTVPLVDDASLRGAIEALIEHPPEVSVLTTGVGMRGLVAAAEGVGREELLLDAMAVSEVVARGPKAVGAAVAVGLHVAWKAPTERNQEVVEYVADRARAGARIAVQRDGDDRPLVAMALEELGAEVIDVPVYRWVLPEEIDPALRLLDAVCAGNVDAVTFTSSPAIRNLFRLAEQADARHDLVTALNSHTLAACVGPVCVATVSELGVANTAMPVRARLGALVQAVVVALGGRVRSYVLGGVDVAVQGAVAVVDGEAVQLTERERRVFDVLARAGGAVVPKRQLLREVWRGGSVDEHAVEVTVARLRRRLGVSGAAVETVPRRGYRLQAGSVPRAVVDRPPER